MKDNRKELMEEFIFNDGLTQNKPSNSNQYSESLLEVENIFENNEEENIKRRRNTEFKIILENKEFMNNNKKTFKKKL